MTPQNKPKMRMGIGSYTWPHTVEQRKIGVADILARAIAHGLDCVQLCDNLPWDSLCNLSEPPLPVELGTSGLKTLESWLALAKNLRSPILRFVIDTADQHPDAEEVTAFLRPFVPRLEMQGTILAIENHDRFPAATLARMVTELNSPSVGICLDTANSLGAGEGLATVLEALAPYTVCLHLKDISIHRVPNKMGFLVEGARPNEGIVDFARTWAHVADHRRCQSVILEQWPPNAACEMEWAEAGIAWMKSHVGKEQTK